MGSSTFEVRSPLVTERAVFEDSLDIGDPGCHLKDQRVPLCVRDRSSGILVLLVVQRLHELECAAHGHKRRDYVQAFLLIHTGLLLKLALEQRQPFAIVEALVELGERVHVGCLQELAFPGRSVCRGGSRKLLQHRHQFLDILREAGLDVFIFGHCEFQGCRVLLRGDRDNLALEAGDGQAGKRVEEEDEPRIGAGYAGFHVGVDARGIGNLVEGDSGGSDSDEGVGMRHGFRGRLVRQLVRGARERGGIWMDRWNIERCGR